VTRREVWIVTMEILTQSSEHVAGVSDLLIDAFVAQFHGQVLQPGDAGYEPARLARNGMIDRRPSLIARCTGVADVVSAVDFARDNGLVLSVRGGGHNVAGNAVNDGGLVTDLDLMRSVHVDLATGTVRAEGGATWSDLDRETQLFGMAVPGGVVSSTGIGGLTLHGGYGHLRRLHGLGLDNLVSVEIVTADGSVRTASADREPDLFWAVRGAGSNFGVVTSLQFRMHPVGPEVTLVGVAYPQSEAESVLRGWRDYLDDTPDEVSSLALLWNVPEIGGFPPELTGVPVVLVAGVHPDPVEGARIMQPLRELGTPVLDLSGPHLYASLQASFDIFFPQGRHYYWKSICVDDLSDDAIKTLAERGRARLSAMSAVTIWHLGGAIARVASETTAYGRRDAPFLVAAEATWPMRLRMKPTSRGLGMPSPLSSRIR
jgi:FAD/FMN-containing dehydrogenase